MTIPAGIEFGTTICDMHDGYDLSMLPGATIVDKITLEFNHGAEFIEQLVELKSGKEYTYHNKHLVVVGETFDGLTLAFSYDGCVLTILNVSLI